MFYRTYSTSSGLPQSSDFTPDDYLYTNLNIPKFTEVYKSYSYFSPFDGNDVALEAISTGATSGWTFTTGNSYSADKKILIAEVNFLSPNPDP